MDLGIGQMKSFGLWYQRKIEDKEISENAVTQENREAIVSDISLHVNFWSLEDIPTSENTSTPYLDIGLKISNYYNLENVVFYCPFVLEKKFIRDLSNKLAEKNNASIIFNADCEIQTKDSYTIVEVSESEKLLIFPLEQVIADVFSVESVQNGNGTQIVFRFGQFRTYVEGVEKLKDLNTLYIRFRIVDRGLKQHMYFDSEPMNKSFESAFSGTRIIDFKVNEKRNIEENVRAEIIVKKQEWVKLKNIHFLIMVPSSYDLTSFYKGPMTCRELEENLWDDYLGEHIDFNKGHVLAYHWKGKDVEDFSCLVKVNYSRAKKKTIFAYALSVISLGILSSLIVTFIDSWCQSDMYLVGVGSIVFVLFLAIALCLGKNS